MAVVIIIMMMMVRRMAHERRIERDKFATASMIGSASACHNSKW